jgi:bifunctional DNase/RNase
VRLSEADAVTVIADRIEANGGNVREVRVVPKAEGVWLATVTLADTDDERVGVFTEADLLDS